jgi:hypothetical protein
MTGKKCRVLCFCISLLYGGLYAQAPSDSFQLLVSLPLKVRFATADHLGNVYVITTNNRIEKHAPDGRLLAQYSNNRLGIPSYLDVSNPLKVLVWYPSFANIQLLDRNMTELGALSLIEAGYPEVRVVASAQDGNLWIYDEIGFKLRKISPEGAELFESQPMNMTLPQRPALRVIRDDGALVYASDTTQGALVFNVYAQFQKTITVDQGANLQIENNRLVNLLPSALVFTDTRSFQQQRLAIPTQALAPGAQVWLGPRRLIVANADKIDIYLIHQ